MQGMKNFNNNNMNIQEQEQTIKSKRLQYAIDNNCINKDVFKDIKVVGGAGDEKITAIGKTKGEKYEFTVYDKPIIPPGMKEVHGEGKNITADPPTTKYWKCEGMFDISNDTTPTPPPTPNDDNDDNGGNDNSPITNWKSNFCIKCTDSEGSITSTKVGLNLNYRYTNQSGIFGKFGLDIGSISAKYSKQQFQFNTTTETYEPVNQRFNSSFSGYRLAIGYNFEKQFDKRYSVFLAHQFYFQTPYFPVQVFEVLPQNIIQIGVEVQLNKFR